MRTRVTVQAAIISLLLLSSISRPVQGQRSCKTSAATKATEDALHYFQKTCPGDLDRCLKSIRPAGVSATDRIRLISIIRSEDVVPPSAERQAKLDGLIPILRFHERPDVAIKIVR